MHKFLWTRGIFVAAKRDGEYYTSACACVCFISLKCIFEKHSRMTVFLGKGFTSDYE